MFIRPSTILFSAVALAGVAIAVPTALEARQVSQCNTGGGMQCCTNIVESYSSFYNELYGFLGLPVPASGSQLGLSCSPITASGSGSGSSCTSQPVCCTGNVFNGVVGIGCSALTLNA